MLPLKTFSKRIENKEKPWLTKGIITSIRKKNNISKKICRTKEIQKSKMSYLTYSNSTVIR